MQKRFVEITKALTYFTEIALTAIIPIILWICVAGYVKNKFGLGEYVTAIGIILGVLTAYVNIYKLFKRISAESSRKDSSDDKKE